MDESSPMSAPEEIIVSSNKINNGFRVPMEEEKISGGQLIGRGVEIYWEGDEVYYTGKIISYDESTRLYMVKYDEGDEEPYEEDLCGSSAWRIYGGDKASYAGYLREKVRMRLNTPCRLRIGLSYD
jgi:Lamin-B receptor of TUDOR domain